MALTKSLSFSLGRKRILISDNSCNLDEFSAEFESLAPMKRLCGEGQEELVVKRNCSSVDSSLLESLPREILIKVVCAVNHDDLKQLFHVSKTVREATVIAKQSHFAFSTPTKTKAFRNSIDLLNNTLDLGDFDAPNAPKQDRRKNRRRISSKNFEDISVALFADDEEAKQRWPRRSLFM